MAHTSEYEIEDIFIDRLEGIGYKFIKLNNYDEVLANFREQLAKFNAKKLEEKGHTASFSDSEFNRIMIHVDNHSVYESAKVLRDKYDLQLDNGESVYIEFFSGDTDRNIYQVTHQVTMDKAHKDDVVYKNRYDVTVLINGLPLVQIELKRPGVEINEAINQINRYRKFSFKGIFRYLQLFVVSNSVQTKYFCNENEMLDGQYNPILKSLVFFWTDEKNTRINDLNTFTGEFFRKSAITEMLNKYMVIKTTEPVLMVMRPYQIYAVKAAKKRVLEVNQNGYVFACTGSGKTLTSFKLAQILRDEPMVDLVVFLIDRKDLDDQTNNQIDLYGKNHPGYKTIFLVLDESSAYFEMESIMDNGVIKGKPHYWFWDNSFVNILKKLNIDYLIWYAPFKYYEVPLGEEKSDLPEVCVIDIKNINQNGSYLNSYDISKMKSVEL